MKNELSSTISDLHTKSDSELLALSRTQPAVFEVLVSRYQQEFTRKAYRIVRDTDEAQDIVQEVFIRIYKYGHKFKHQEGATFKSWAYTILTNTCYTYCKKKKRRSDFIKRADDDMLESFSAGTGEFENKLDLNQIMTAIGRIPAMLGRMLTLSLAGKTQEEIAALEGVPVGTVRTRLHRAKKEVRKHMAFYAVRARTTEN
jgi:RNA polymerase sigma-70 factor (ECF subfamily)